MTAASMIIVAGAAVAMLVVLIVGYKAILKAGE